MAVKPNIEQEYMRHKLKLSEAIMEFIYEKQDKLLEARIVDLAYQNQGLLNATTPTFIYKGDWYPESLADRTMTKPFNTILDSSLHENMEELLNTESFEKQMEREKIKHCISQFCIAARTVKDVHNLFPAQIISHLQDTFQMDDMSGAPDPLPLVKIAEIKKENSQALLALNKLFVTRLLLSDV